MNEKDKEFDKKQQILLWFTYLAIFIFLCHRMVFNTQRYIFSFKLKRKKSQKLKEEIEAALRSASV